MIRQQAHYSVQHIKTEDTCRKRKDNKYVKISNLEYLQQLLERVATNGNARTASSEGLANAVEHSRPIANLPSCHKSYDMSDCSIKHWLFETTTLTTYNCWLSSHHGLMWSFVGPACVIILINTGVFILTLRSASSVRVKREQTAMKKIKSWARGSLSVMCLLGLTWCLGLFYINRTLHVFSYIFIILNGLQGVFIFVFHILLNEKIKNICFMKWKRKKEQNWNKHLTQSSSNRIHSKLSTRTSVDSNGCANYNEPGRRSRKLSNILPAIKSPK
ncbi:adhesion G protein-coupled receptor L3 [Nephila pilipes]|uniref:Adhesion G protein-coupled receptor L3 n=1 Tax=Nephila pilipes TaxID=299642 RepID=A0A8X6U0M3_NEPPI|nr:adhesion G protein-coupled receptor L3 [Nephila pilipes]